MLRMIFERAMRRIASKALALTVLAITTVAAVAQQSPAEIYRNSIDFIFTIYTSEAQGTGFTYSKGYIATNAHVVGNETTVVVETQKGERFNATVVDKDENLDWALLKPEGIAPFPSTVLSLPRALPDTTPDIGEPVVVIGSPGGLKGTVTTGIVSQILADGVIELNVAVNPGNSGGPVFNSDGQVFGIATAKYTGGDGIGFAIPLDRIKWK